MIAVWLALGAIGGAAFAAVGWRRDLTWWAGWLVVAALLYVGFALARGAWTDATVELVGVAVYGAVAALGVRFRQRRDRHRAAGLVAAAWALHPVWDLGVHIGLGLEAPSWYVWACLAFDLVAAASLASRGRRPDLS